DLIKGADMKLLSLAAALISTVMMSNAAYAQMPMWGYGMYGAMQPCGYNYGPAAGATDEQDEVNDAQQSIRDIQDKIRDARHDLQKAKNNEKKYEREIQESD